MQCRICGNENDNLLYEAREMMYGLRDIFRYFHCSQCNCLQIEEFPSDMSRYYCDKYYAYKPISGVNRVKKFLINLRNNYAVFNRGIFGKIIFSRTSNKILRCLNPIPITKNSDILDVGCGAGHLLFALRELGFNNLLGIDPFIEKDIEYENGLKVLKKTIHDVDGKWDLIMFHHSFEHIPDPLESLHRVSEVLKFNGYCVIRIPTVSSYAWKHYGVNWVQLDTPRHFFLHSVESIRILAEKTGLELCSVVYDSTAFQFWGSEQYKMGIPLRDNRSYAVSPEESVFLRKEIAAFTKHAEELNRAKQGDQAIFYLRRN